MNNIEWKDGAVCYAYGKQMDVDRWNFEDMFCMHLSDFDDFQLNEIREGDFIPASELDTEQKYNEVVEVFGLFGFERVKDSLSYSRLSVGATHYLASDDYGIDSVSNDIAFKNYCKGRQLTYNQLMVMGELKRMMNSRDIKQAVKNTINAELDKPVDNVKRPSHYQLIEGVESIEIIARSMTQKQWKGFCLGNMLKYRIRAGKKDALQQDIDKANFYGELYEMHKEKCYDN